jgi:RNA polymerase sigma-70 factor (ECF subfamily)
MMLRIGSAIGPGIRGNTPRPAGEQAIRDTEETPQTGAGVSSVGRSDGLAWVECVRSVKPNPMSVDSTLRMAAAHHELVRRCRRGELKAWDELVRCFAPMAYRIAFRMLSDAASAEDATQETFLRMFRSFDSYDVTRPLEPWVARITVNVCVKRLQAPSARERTTEDGSESHHGIADTVAPSPEHQAASRELLRSLEDGFLALSPQDRALLTLRFREGLSEPEVAEAMQMPVNTVKTRVHRARAQLARYLASSNRGGSYEN